MHPTAQPATRTILATAALLFAAPGQAADLEVTLTGMHSADGQALVALHRDSPGNAFPDEAGAVATQARPAGTGKALVFFPDLPPGQYAVAAFHDATDDGELNTNFAGMPLEGYGFSNDARGFMGPPSFAAAAVTIGPDDGLQRIAVAIQCPESLQ